jgi:hypothetical protein
LDQLLKTGDFTNYSERACEQVVGVMAVFRQGHSQPSPGSAQFPPCSTGRQEFFRGREFLPLLPCSQVGNRSDKCFWRKPSITHQQLARLGTRGSMIDDIDNRLRQLCELAKLEHQPDKIKVLAQEIAQLLVEKLKCQPPDRKAG